MELNPADERPVYRQIVEEIERCVAVGVMRPDEALPAAAALAKDLKVNINTVQHAYIDVYSNAHTDQHTYEYTSTHEDLYTNTDSK